MGKKLAIGMIVVFMLVTVVAAQELEFIPRVIPFPRLLAAAQCQNIYARFPSYRCCGEATTETNDNKNLPAGSYWQCPTTASRCEVKVPQIPYGSSLTGWYKGSKNCQPDWLGTFWCSDASRMTDNTWLQLAPGDYVLQNSGQPQTFQEKVYGLKLCEGSFTSACPRVPGSTQCGFTTSDPVFLADGLTDAPGSFSYTVPQGECYSYFPVINRRVIGDTCETCSSTADCATLYGSTYTYQGVQYGSVCTGNSVQLYDCLSTGSTTCTEWYDSNDNGVQDSGEQCINSVQAPRCDLYLSLPVECCPGTSSCGSQAFCDPSTYKCVSTAQCTKPTDCGHTVSCDWTTQLLKTPDCVSGQCDWDEQAVECCNDYNCPSGEYCDSDWTCKTKPTVKQPCPYQCCSNEQAYFDKTCQASSPVCCPDHSCATTAQACGGSGGIDLCLSDADCDDSDPCTVDKCAPRTGQGNVCVNSYDKDLPGCGGDEPIIPWDIIIILIVATIAVVIIIIVYKKVK